MSPRSARSAFTRSPLKLFLSGAFCTLLLATAVGCGSEDGQSDPGTATDTSTSEPTRPDTSTSPAPSSPSTVVPSLPGEEDTSGSESGQGATLVVGEAVKPGQAVIVSASNVKVATSKQASALSNDEAVEAFLATMDEQLSADVRRAVEQAQVLDDTTLFGAVASVGCEAPTSVDWTRTFDGIEVQATLPKPSVQCLVPVTSVALFLVPSAVG